MNTKIKNPLQTIFSITLAVLFSVSTVHAIGTLTPTGTAGDDTQYTLNDIYTKLTTGATTTVGTGTMTVPGTATSTFNTLTEIYEAVPEWLTLSSATTTVAEGYYEAADLATIDTDLVAGNIKEGETIFGVEGDLPAGVTYPTEWSADNPAGNVNWTTATSYCDTLEESTHTDWRLPTYIELVNAFLTSNPGNSLGFQSDVYWSSTAYPGIAAYGIFVNMSDGSANSTNKTYQGVRARCTR